MLTSLSQGASHDFLSPPKKSLTPSKVIFHALLCTALFFMYDQGQLRAASAQAPTAPAASSPQSTLATPLKKDIPMTHTLPTLPYAMDGLAPHISENTMNFHYGKHHQAYVTKLNELIAGKDYEKLNLEETIKKSWTDKNAGVFNNAAQVWNHTFYWNCMKKNGGGEPSGTLMAMIVGDFGSFDAFKTEFKNAALTQFGSGWAWLVLHNDKLEIMKTPNGETPMNNGAKALLTCDVWEHAYYLDFQNRRPDYVDTFLNHLVNWEFVASQL